MHPVSFFAIEAGDVVVGYRGYWNDPAEPVEISCLDSAGNSFILTTTHPQAVDRTAKEYLGLMKIMLNQSATGQFSWS